MELVPSFNWDVNFGSEVWAIDRKNARVLIDAECIQHRDVRSWMSTTRDRKLVNDALRKGEECSKWVVDLSGSIPIRLFSATQVKIDDEWVNVSYGELCLYLEGTKAIIKGQLSGKLELVEF